MTQADLASYSLVAIYSAMTVYALAFIFFALDLARRASEVRALVSPAAAKVSSRVSQRVSAGAVGATASGRGGTALLDPPSTSTLVGDSAGADPTGKVRHAKTARIAMALTTIGWILHVGGTVLRGVAAHRVPWENMFEFTITATAIIIGVFLFMQFWNDMRFLGAYVTGFVTIFLGVATTNYYVDVIPTPPPLQSYWLVIHVFVASLGTGFFGLGAGLAVVQLLQARRAGKGLPALPAIPNADRLETLSYRLNVVGFVFWTFTLMAGAIWADHAWGRYWGWDTKEVWTLIVWVIYAGYIHARATRNWRGSRSATLAIIGFSAVLFNFTIVNIFFHGLHSYSGL